MNFLQLSQHLRREAGISGSGPSSVVGQTGEMERVVNWINAAWMDIQMESEAWKWMRKSGNCVVTSSNNQYSYSDFSITHFRHWWTDTGTCYLQSNGVSDEQFLPFMEYDKFREWYLVGSQTPSRPQVFTVSPGNAILLGPYPDSTYVVKLDYQESARELSGNTDSPAMPEMFHWTIIWRALMMYGEYESAPEVVSRGRNNFNRWSSRLRLDQLPDFQQSPPLVE